MNKKPFPQKIAAPGRISSYFKMEIASLLIVTVTGIIYNVGMTAGPYFEGQLAQRLFDIMHSVEKASSMLPLAATYLAVILAVQAARAVKRFYIRRFANDTSRNMRHMLYNNLVHRSKRELDSESVGAAMTRAVSDVDTCVEGMRKFTTEMFDTGVMMAAYLVMLLIYDWRLALISCAFTPFAYIIAGRLKKVVSRSNSKYKSSAENLNDATMDRIENAVTYRVYGREQERDAAYERRLEDYEKTAVAANIWANTMQPLYNVIAMAGVIFIVCLGGRNVLGQGWKTWDIAAFTTFLSCFARLALRASKAAKLFNAVQKAQVSWRRIKPLMNDYTELSTDTAMDLDGALPLEVSRLTFSYPGGEPVIRDLSFFGMPGEIIGVTGPVASGKSTLGKVFLCEAPYGGSIRIGDRELSSLSEYERSRVISYMGHQPELLSDTVAENVKLGQNETAEPFLDAVCLTDELARLPNGANTYAGSGGAGLSGGQQARVALARTLYHAGRVLILDDPFSAVDRSTEREIMARLRMLAEGRIVILISHRLDLLPQFEQVIFLERGIGTVGTHESLMKESGLYCELYNAQMAGGDSDEA